MTCQSIHVGLNQGKPPRTIPGKRGQGRADLAVSQLPRPASQAKTPAICCESMRFRSRLRSAPPGLRFGRIDEHFGPTRRQALCEPPASSSARWRGSSQWFIAISEFARISKLSKEPIVGKGRARDATNHHLLQTSVDFPTEDDCQDVV